LWWLGIDIRIATDFTGVPVVSLPLLIVNIVFLLIFSRHVCLRAQGLRRYTGTLGVRLGPDDLSPLYSLRAVLVVWIVLVAASALVFDPLIFRMSYSVYQSLLRVFITSYLSFIQATFLWVLGYSMYTIYRWGKLPLRLKSFVEDGTLGLSAYGRASLFSVTLYVAAVLLTFPMLVYPSAAVMVSQAIFLTLGLGIFIAPLLGLRRKLTQAKHEKLGWIRLKHRRVMEAIELSGMGLLEGVLVNELIAIDSIRRDLQQIHTWPFNAGVLAKLITVVVLPLVVAMVATYLIRILQL
jgi:hypothetical protein